MDELTFDGKTYVSSKRAATITGYAKDYVGQLCREGRVQARLVGRNWYVLESSIREHRFGAETQKRVISNESDLKNESMSTWEAPTYASEVDATLPEFINQEQKIVDRAQEYEAPMAHINESAVVQEMQNAWQDWFSKKSHERELDEDLLESPEVMDSRDDEITSEDLARMGENEQNEETIAIHPLEEEEVEPVEEDVVSIDRADDLPVSRSTENYLNNHVKTSFEEEEIVPVHRTYVPPVTVTPPSYRENSYDYNQAYAPEGRIIRERRSRRKRKPSGALRAFFIAIMVISLAIATIGSGKVLPFFGNPASNYGPVRYLEGQSAIDRASK
jgi:hypothetical protein